MQSVEVPGYPDREGETKPRINAANKNGLSSCEGYGSNLIEVYIDTISKIGPDSQVFGYQPDPNEYYDPSKVIWLSRMEFFIRFKNLAIGLMEIGFVPSDNIGICSKNRIEWVLAEFATCYLGSVVVPIFDNVEKVHMNHIIKEAELRYLFVTCDRAKFILSTCKNLDFTLDFFIIMDEIDSEFIDMLEELSQPEQKQLTKNINIITVDQLEKIGSDKLSAMGRSQPNDRYGYVNSKLEDIYTISYTSGTTGTPKGVVLTYANIISSFNSISIAMKNKHLRQITTKDKYLSILPLGHMQGRFCTYVFMIHGCKIGFPSKDFTKVMHDIQMFKPTIFIGVPRIFTRIKQNVFLAVEKRGGLVSMLFKYALKTKMKNLRKGVARHFIFDRVVFKSVSDQLGGKVSLIVSSAAPASGETLGFIRCCFPGKVHEAYGLTETSAPCTLTLESDISGATVGPPISSSMVKLVDVPEMGYFCTDKPYPRGELCAFGPGVFKGYYKQPENTRDAIDSEGWFHTGDIASFDNYGRVIIIDRKKNVFKLSQGEFVAPEKVEKVYTDHPLINQIFVYGSPFKPCAVGIIVPNMFYLEKLLDVQSKDVDSLESSSGIIIENPKSQTLENSSKNETSSSKNIPSASKSSNLNVSFEKSISIKSNESGTLPKSDALSPLHSPQSTNVVKQRQRVGTKSQLSYSHPVLANNSVSIKNPSLNSSALNEKFVLSRNFSSDLANGNVTDVLNDFQVRKLVIKELNSWLSAGELRPFEKLKNIHLDSISFDDRNLVTSSMKLKRFEAEIFYKSILNRLYNEIGEI
ncbi:hypothetical protein BB559_002635 [Furculomyces boomerangus]|uniref:AMP-dependent synthetase/ligase domain-containing protein n=1 Tax=Furculomyces boomerangus TaxID=61424 RepID=A0A2T9YTK6_9FUNG|nr:hypothetical protein BB559_002635 [Furculomyces boomerangus]